MKKNIIVALLLCFSIGTLFAQSAIGNSADRAQFSANANAKAKDIADRLNNMLQLSPDQYARVLEEYKNFYSIVPPVAENSQLPKDSNIYKRNKSLIDARNEKLKGILTPDQWQKAEDAGLVRQPDNE